MQFKVPEVPEPKKVAGGKPEKPVRVFKDPCSEEEMKMMGQKQFAEETYKKMQWVNNMYHSWRLVRNKNDSNNFGHQPT